MRDAASSGRCRARCGASVLSALWTLLFAIVVGMFFDGVMFAQPVQTHTDIHPAILPAAATTVIVPIGPIDGQILVQEALDKSATSDFSMRLTPNGQGFGVKNGEIVLNAVIAYRGISCAVHLEGLPLVVQNKLGIDSPKITTDGVACNLALVAFVPLARKALESHPWDLARRLSRASTDSSLPGPRLDYGCIREDQLTITAAVAKDSQLVVDLVARPRATGTSCP
jgi:hypothetical protein